MDTSDSVEQRVMRALLKRCKKAGCVPTREYVFSRAYTDAAEFATDYMLMNLLSKWKGGTDASAARSAAIDAWYGAESQSFSTNLRLDRLPPAMLPFIWRVQQKIADVIGDKPDMEELSSLCRWGPGATFDIRRKDASAATKHTRSISVTRRCLPHLLQEIDPLWADAMGTNGFHIVRGNRCVTVPKSAKTDRMIAVEPTGNSFLQAGVGRFMRSRLKLVGIDLDDQSVNQGLAEDAFVRGLATIDLSSASDTMSRALVDLLLPPKWTAYLEDLRSPYSYLDGKWVRLEKFSSMGNGFTFELESLIFWALCSEASERDDTKVYGDDIIISSERSRDVIAVLQFCGFTVNKEKSFTSGPFYESCGRHYWQCADVTPVYQKEICDGSVPELVRFHNRLFRWGRRTGLFHLVIDSLLIIRKTAADLTRGKFRYEDFLLVPESLPGDFGFLNSAIPFSEKRRYLVLSEKTSFRDSSELEDLGSLSFKIRAPHLHMNPRPDGRGGFVKGARYVYCRRTFWRSSLAAADAFAPTLV